MFDGEKCAVCGKPVSREDGLRVETVLWERTEEDGSKTWGSEQSSFCSLECLFKWTWDLMIPRSLYFSTRYPTSVVDLEEKLEWEDIARKKAELLKLIGVRA